MRVASSPPDDSAEWAGGQDNLVETAISPRVNKSQFWCTTGNSATLCKFKHFCLFFFQKFQGGWAFQIFFIFCFSLLHNIVTGGIYKYYLSYNNKIETHKPTTHLFKNPAKWTLGFPQTPLPNHIPPSPSLMPWSPTLLVFVLTIILFIGFFLSTSFSIYE